jgi:hypothetical protein
MDRIQVVQHKGKQVLIQDFTGATPGEEFRATLEAAKTYIASQPPKSILSVFDGTGSRYNVEVLSALKDFAKHNEPYMKASSIVGMKGILSIALMGVARFTGRVFKTFEDRQSAMDWLVEQ